MNLDCPGVKSLGPYFGIPEAPSLVAVPAGSSSISVTRILREVEQGEDARVSLPCCDAYLLMLYLEDTVHSDVKGDGTLAPPRPCAGGSICVVDLCNGAAVVLHESLSSLAIFLPKALIADVAELSFPTKSTKLRCRRAEPDAVVSSLGIVILALFRTPSAETVLGHLGLALCTHLIQDCIDDASDLPDDVTLPLRREAVAKEFMLRNLALELSVSDIAAAAGLSANHFSQGFKKVTGYTPHQWLMHARVNAAKDLLCQTELPLRSIADACGFADHSHLTKVFSRETGMTPALWRAKGMN